MKKLIRKILSLFSPQPLVPGSQPIYPPDEILDSVATCFFTGKTNNVCMYPLKNDKNQLIGFLFVDPEKHFSELRVNWMYKQEDESSFLDVKTYA